MVSTKDDEMDRDVQTDDLGQNDKFNQAPEDIVVSYD